MTITICVLCNDDYNLNEIEIDDVDICEQESDICYDETCPLCDGGYGGCAYCLMTDH